MCRFPGQSLLVRGLREKRKLAAGHEVPGIRLDEPQPDIVLGKIPAFQGFAAAGEEIPGALQHDAD